MGCVDPGVVPVPIGIKTGDVVPVGDVGVVVGSVVVVGCVVG